MTSGMTMRRMEAAKVYDVPPWVIGARSRPCFADLRWRLRRVAPWLVWR